MLLSIAGLGTLVVGYLGLFPASGDSVGLDTTCEASACAKMQGAAEASNSLPELKPCPYCGQDAALWRTQTSVEPPVVSAKSTAVVESACGSLIYGISESERLPPASLTKIVTAMAVAEQARLGDKVGVAVNGWDLVTEDGSSVMGLEAGMTLSVQDLLYGLLLPSGNDAALALAEYVGGTPRLVDLMNKRVSRLGLTNTRFVNPDGRDAPGQYSSAFDMALLGRDFLADSMLGKIAAAPSYQPDWPGGVLWNGNYLLQAYRGAIGVKIGYTDEAGYTMVAAARREGRELIVVVLGSTDLYLDATRLLDWAFLNTTPNCSRQN